MFRKSVMVVPSIAEDGISQMARLPLSSQSSIMPKSQPLLNHIFVLFEMFGKHVVDVGFQGTFATVLRQEDVFDFLDEGRAYLNCRELFGWRHKSHIGNELLNILFFSIRRRRAPPVV